MTPTEVLGLLRLLPVKERLRVIERAVHEVAENELRDDVAIGRSEPKRRAGSAAGRVHMAPDFDAPLEDFAACS